MMVAGGARRRPTVYGRTPAEAVPVVAGSSAAVGQRPLFAAEIDNEIARHFERVRMLLVPGPTGEDRNEEPER